MEMKEQEEGRRRSQDSFVADESFDGRRGNPVNISGGRSASASQRPKLGAHGSAVDKLHWICGCTKVKCTVIAGAVVGLVLVIVLATVLKPSGASLAPADDPNEPPNNSDEGAGAGAGYQESGEKFKYLSYADIVIRLKHLHEAYPQLTELYSTQERFGLESAGDCKVEGQTQPCYVYVLTIGNKHKRTPSTPEVFLSGELHGNERIGPTATVEFATLLLDMYHSDVWARRLVDTRSITIVPTANAVGYHHNTREELGVDPNRDFAWDQNPNSCMQTVAAQSINELWRAHVFQLSVTFHGGDHMISYPWGDNIHCCSPSKYTTADATGMAALTEVMRDFVGRFDTDGPYQIGPLNKIIYPVAGGMEDWAYGASWAPNGRGNVDCHGKHSYPNGRTSYNNATHRAINLLVETAFAKTPRASTLGASKQVLNGGGGHDGDGHIPRNVRLCWMLADMVQPWVHIVNLHQLPTQATVGTEVVLQWEAGGAVEVNEARVECYLHGDASQGAAVCQSAPTFNHRVWEQGRRTAPVSTTVRLQGGLAAGDVVVMRIRVRVDEGWAAADRAEASHGTPQSHFVRARTDPSFFVSNPGSPGQTVQGQEWWETEEATIEITGRRSLPSPSVRRHRQHRSVSAPAA